MPSSLLSDLSFSAQFSALLAARGLHDPQAIRAYLYPDETALIDPFEMKGMREAVDRVRKAVGQRERILVHGDYDADGVTGAAIVTRSLSELGAQVKTFLPDRSEDGYGVSDRAISEAVETGVKLLITVDCGIAAHDAIQRARDSGIDVIVLDHHRIPSAGLPPATVILNPLQQGCAYAFKDLSAGGLAFKLAQALMGERAYRYFDVAAVSTVCDMAPLTGENRIIVGKGLDLLSKRSQTGLRALAEVSKIRARSINVGHIGFMYGPRINAAGRMGSPDMALRLLLTDVKNEAASLASALNEENKVRQKEERQLVKQAVFEVERTVNFNRDRVIVVTGDGWHAGVIGIVAARLVDKYQRPAVVIAVQDGVGKGSGRSVKAFNLFQALSACADVFEEFGGHSQAAGLVIKKEKIPEFRTRINEYAAETADVEVFREELAVDLELSLADIRTPLLKELALLEPHGIGNPRPLFQGRGLSARTKPVRTATDTYQFWITDGYVVYEAVCHPGKQGFPLEWLQTGRTFDIKYRLKLKRLEGEERVSLEIRELTSS